MREPSNILPDFGKVPPQAIEMEQSVLGILMTYPDTIHEIKLRPEMFYKDSHQKIFSAIQELSAGKTCDLISVTTLLRDKGQLESVGGPFYITQLTSSVVTQHTLEYHAQIVLEKYLQREYIRIGMELQARGYNTTIEEISEFAETSLFNLTDTIQTREPEHISKCIDEVIENVNLIITKQVSLVGVPSGYTAIDRVTGGWQPGDLIIVAGRPSMGKTALALALGLNASNFKTAVLMFSLEMSRGQLATRYLSTASGYTNVEIRSARVDFDKLLSDSNSVARQSIYIDDTAHISIAEMRSKVKKSILRHKVGMVIVDYLQLMSADAQSREQEVSKISRGLKGIAKEFEIPVIALSQLNRDVEARGGDKRPRLSDLRESGAIEQDADAVCFVYRPAYYKIDSIEINEERVPTEGLMVVDCAKNRNGGLFSVPLYHNSAMSVITDTKVETNGVPY